MTVTTVDIEAQVDGGSNANIFDKYKYFFAFIRCKGNIQQVAGVSGNMNVLALHYVKSDRTI